MARESFRRDQDALGAGGDQVFHGGDLTVIVAVDLAGERTQLRPFALAASSAPAFILTKNGFVLVLVMRPTIVCRRANALDAEGKRECGHGEKPE